MLSISGSNTSTTPSTDINNHRRSGGRVAHIGAAADGVVRLGRGAAHGGGRRTVDAETAAAAVDRVARRRVVGRLVGGSCAVREVAAAGAVGTAPRDVDRLGHDGRRGRGVVVGAAVPGEGGGDPVLAGDGPGAAAAVDVGEGPAAPGAGGVRGSAGAVGCGVRNGGIGRVVGGGDGGGPAAVDHAVAARVRASTAGIAAATAGVALCLNGAGSKQDEEAQETKRGQNGPGAGTAQERERPRSGNGPGAGTRAR